MSHCIYILNKYDHIFAILESGQADIGKENNDGTSTSIVLLEVSTKTIKETFLADGGDSSKSGDHRVFTKTEPLSVDIYVQVAVPQDKKIRDGIFAMISPTPTGDPRVSTISIQDIYDQFAKMQIRGNVREIFAKYENADSVMANYAKINAEISLMIIHVIEQSKAPFTIISAQLSNVTEDPTVLASKNALVAANNISQAKIVNATAEARQIQIIGDALRKNPQYLDARRLNVIETVGTSDKSNLIIMDTKSSTTIALPANR